MQSKRFSNRRELLRLGVSAAASSLACQFGGPLWAQTLTPLDVASAGSIRPMLEGPVKSAIAQSLHLDLHCHAQGADAVAASLVDGSLRADVFIPVTAGPMRTIMRAGKADTAPAIARTEMVIVYSPKSRFVRQFEAAAQGRANWWEVLEQPGLRFVRSNPAGDPGGRNIIFTMMLAAKKYRRPDLVEKVLGPTLNPEQILTGGNNQAMLLSGELDAGGSYRIAPAWNHLPYITLPNDINLSGLHVHEDHPEISISLSGKTFYPEPLVYYAAELKNAANPRGARAFLNWLATPEAQQLFRAHTFAGAEGVPALHA
jgi:molybdate/tungstate transport system substrate-binding protein